MGTSLEWRCFQCKKLLGVYRDGLLYLRFSRHNEIVVKPWVTSKCRGCKTLNHFELPRAARAEDIVTQ
jgi:phage FluMu protein Com